MDSPAGAPAARGADSTDDAASILRFCLSGDPAELPTALDAPARARLRRRVFAAASEALRGAGSDAWLQVALRAPPSGFGPDLYRSLAQHVEELLRSGAVRSFFFMRKPPGLRLRFQVQIEPESIDRERLRARLASLVTAGLATDVIPGVYEPESYLFGGAHSMTFVHEAFALDSLAWLAYHALDDASRTQAPAWTFSLALLGPLFRALAIADWEDLDVWERIAARAGRGLPDAIASDPGYESAADGVRALWARPSALADALPTQAAEITSRYSTAVADVGRAWLDQYVAGADARVGPRALAALLTIFHWNRAGLSLERQALLTHALLRRPIL